MSSENLKPGKRRTTHICLVGGLPEGFLQEVAFELGLEDVSLSLEHILKHRKN